MRQPLHLVCGPPGGGKSTHGTRLARALRAAFFDSDTATERLVRAGLHGMGLSPDDRDSPSYKATFREAVYETLFDLAEANLEHVPVVIAGPFTRESGEPDWLERLEQRFRTAVTVHFVHTDADIRRHRLARRGEPRDLAKLADWSGYVASCREEPPPFAHVFVSGEAAELADSPASAEQRDQSEHRQQGR